MYSSRSEARKHTPSWPTPQAASFPLDRSSQFPIVEVDSPSHLLSCAVRWTLACFAVWGFFAWCGSLSPCESSINLWRWIHVVECSGFPQLIVLLLLALWSRKQPSAAEGAGVLCFRSQGVFGLEFLAPSTLNTLKHHSKRPKRTETLPKRARPIATPFKAT